MTSAHDVLHELRAPTRDLRQAIPDVWEGFGALHDAAMSDGALTGKEKQLIALAIAVAKRCDGCIASHARSAARLGASRAEVAEALGVALLMDGGTATVYGPRAWQAYLEYAASEMASSLGPARRSG
ncbi:MAG TPA: carboxymuconolactone decarboxylase family protein [Acidimicrobiia bacterium]|nr:carboxymuconolactone decarboxylase family protein [Acidimicrobiia bacterium]